MYKLHLILKYLRRRRIAWVSLLAVMLCTTMVLVVISVMGGWLDMFESNARGLTGDVVIRAQGMSGFSYSEEMIEAIEKDPQVVAAVPTIETFGLLNLQNLRTSGVRVMGIPLESIGKVNKFPQSLYRQHKAIEEALANPKLAPDERAKLQEQLAQPPTFDLHRTTSVPLAEVPDDVPWLDRDRGKIGSDNDPLWDRIRYTPGFLTLTGRLTDAEKDRLLGLSPSPSWKTAVRRLANESNWPGMIASSGVLDIRRGPDGKIEGREPWKYTLWGKLTMIGISANQSLDEKNKSEAQFWVVDDSRTGMWQYDNDHVYVPFEYLQQILGMGPGKASELMTFVSLHKRPQPSDLKRAPFDGRYFLSRTDGKGPSPPDPVELKKGETIGFEADAQDHIVALAGSTRVDLGAAPASARWSVEQEVPVPARVTAVDIRLVDGADVVAGRDRIAAIVSGIDDRHGVFEPDGPKVETWKEVNALFIGAIENEKLLVVFLFGIISIVAIFLIFCIFYMIVAEKTKDIGIIKSVGATSMGVAGIFLGYGLVIGIVGAGLGLIASYLIVHNINQIHTWIGKTFHLVIWNPQIYAFETIPNKMNPREVTIIIGVAILASVIGALVPAVRAARLHPVEALRWE